MPKKVKISGSQSLDSSNYESKLSDVDKNLLLRSTKKRSGSKYHNSGSTGSIAGESGTGTESVTSSKITSLSKIKA
jgi:hypothetical protein